MSRCAAHPSTPRSVRTLNQSVRRNSTSTLWSRSATWNTGYPRPGPVRSSRYGAVTNTSRCSRARLVAGALSNTRASSKPATERLRNDALVDRRGRVERVVEVLRANIQPLRDQAKLGRTQVARMRAARARCKATEERAGERAVGATRIRERSHRNRRRSTVRTCRTRDVLQDAHVNFLLVVREQELLIRIELSGHGIGGRVREIELARRHLRGAHRVLRVVTARLRARVIGR